MRRLQEKGGKKVTTTRLFRDKSIRRKAVNVLMAVLMFLAPGLTIPGCGSNDFLGLEDYQRDLLLGALAIALLSDGGNADPNAGQGKDGLSCFDTNGNGLADPSEDVNGDGFFDAFDCQGSPGSRG